MWGGEKQTDGKAMKRLLATRNEIINSHCEQPTQLDLHTFTNIQSQEANESIDLASPLYDLVVAVPGDFQIDQSTPE